MGSEQDLVATVFEDDFVAPASDITSGSNDSPFAFWQQDNPLVSELRNRGLSPWHIEREFDIEASKGQPETRKLSTEVRSANTDGSGLTQGYLAFKFDYFPRGNFEKYEAYYGQVGVFHALPHKGHCEVRHTRQSKLHFLLQDKDGNNSVCLTRLDFDAIKLLFQGVTKRQIAVKLGIGEETARSKVDSIYRRFGTHNRGELLDFMVTHGFVEFKKNIEWDRPLDVSLPKLRELRSRSVKQRIESFESSGEAKLIELHARPYVKRTDTELSFRADVVIYDPRGKSESVYLTTRQFEFIKFLCQGLTINEIMRECNLSRSTVKNAISELLHIFHVPRVSALLTDSVKKGYLEFVPNTSKDKAARLYKPRQLQHPSVIKTIGSFESKVGASQMYFRVRSIDNLGRMELYCPHQKSTSVILSSRQFEVYELVCRGLTDKEIAKELVISRQTVKNHKTAIYRKFWINNQEELINKSVKKGYIEFIPSVDEDAWIQKLAVYAREQESQSKK